MFITAKNFGGYWVKGVKKFKGHEQEPLFQCTVYKDKKKIGIFSEDSWGGPAALNCPKNADREALCAYAKKHEGEEAWSESFQTFIGEIVWEIERLSRYKKLCKTKLVFRFARHDRNTYRSIPLNKIKDLNKTKDISWEKVRITLEKKTGEKITIVNAELEKL